MKKQNKIIIVSLMSLLMSGCQFAPGLNTASSTLNSSNSGSTIINTSVSNSSMILEEKTLLITPANFNKLTDIELIDVVENTQYPEEFTFNSLGVMKSNKLSGIKKIVLDVYSTYENLIVYNNYTGSGNAIISQKEEGDNKATYTYTFNGENEFYIVNNSETYRTHVYSIAITYMSKGNTSGGSNTGTTNSSSNNNTNNSSSSSSSSSTNNNSSGVVSNHYKGTYYNGKDLTTTGSTLKQTLRTLITNTHTHTTTYAELKEFLQDADQDPNNSNNMILFYTGKSIPKTDDMDIWNREHIWPQSLGWFKTSGAGADVHHLRPCNPSENGSRGNKKFGTASGYYDPSKHGGDFRGDCARIIFYMFTRYSQADSYSFTSVAQSLDMLLEWNELDPVDALEIQRNKIGEKEQGNRNPFIDYPELADAIW